MAVYFITGKLGGGKSLCSVGRIQQYLNEGRKVATNLDLRLEHLVNPWAKNTRVYRMSDKPTKDDFEALPLGYDGDEIDEERNGAIVLDELAIWFNSRSWNDKGRKDVIEWIVHARKRRWDIFFLVQDIDAVDKQARDLFAEHLVTCKRTDRLNIPLIGWLIQPLYRSCTGKRLPMPRLHIATVRYGDTLSAPVVDRWLYRGTDLYDAFDTEQKFYPDSDPIHSILPPWYVYGRYHSKWEHRKNAIKNYALKGYHFFLAGAFCSAMAVNAMVTAMPETPRKGLFTCNKAYRELYGSCDSYPVLPHDKQPKEFREKIEKEAAIAAGNPQPSETGATESEPTQTETLLDSVYITASVKYDDGFDYVFTDGNNTVYPRADGWRVMWGGRCKAILIRGPQRSLIRCHPSDPDYVF